MRSVIAVLGALAFALAGPARTFADFVVTDGTFNNADWTLRVGTNTSGVTPTATQFTADGNPPPSRVNTIDYGSGVGLPALVQDRAFSFYTPFTYNPSTQGPLLSLVYHLQDKDLTIQSSTNATVGFAVMQNGSLYFATVPSDPAAQTRTTFTEINPTNIPDTSASFTRDPAGGGTGGALPNFATGGPIQFGYYVQYDAATPSGATSILVDNFSVSGLTAPLGSPEPSGLFLVGLAGAAFAGPALWRRFRRKDAKPQAA